jgi:hypothetical protein
MARDHERRREPSFTPAIYDLIREGCQRSAAAVVPQLVDLFRPDLVVDVGGGEGWWARAFATAGCRHVLAIDDAVEPGERDGVEFMQADLADVAGLAAYDLAICLEVAEHLQPKVGDQLVAELAATAPIVVFSAAIPAQGGHMHVNEQWPGYWADRFAAVGLACSDSLRWRIWDDDQVEVWYRQNLLVFGQASRLQGLGLDVGRPAGVVHPGLWSVYRGLV